MAINTVVAMEVAHYLIKSLGSEGKRKMDVFLSYPMEIIDFDQYLARKSVEYLAKYSQTGIGGRDRPRETTQAWARVVRPGRRAQSHSGKRGRADSRRLS